MAAGLAPGSAGVPPSNCELPRYYRDANEVRPREYWDYEALSVRWGRQEDYDVLKKIGRGRYSEVFAGKQVASGKPCVVKVLKPVRESKIKREISILQNLYGGPNIVQLLDVVRDPSRGTTSLIFEYVSRSNFRALYSSAARIDVRYFLRYYVYELLRALDHAHAQGIMHRDVKPQNVMIDHATHKIRLIDWGLADFYHPKHEYNVRVASRYYKGPELLVGMHCYDYSLDIWSLGCMLAGIVFQQDPFFRGADNTDQLCKIVRFLGSDGLFTYLEKYGLELDLDIADLVGKQPRWSFDDLIHADNQHLATDDAIDLLSRMLVYDHSARILPREAMLHEYFRPVREQLGPPLP